MTDLQIHSIIAMFHSEEPVSYSVKRIRDQECDHRYVIYVHYPEEAFVIKAASNGFTTAERVNGWATLIEQYRGMGCYSPAIKKSLHDHYAEPFVLDGISYVVWEEEFAKYSFPDDIKDKPMNAKGNRYVYQDELIAFFGKVGQAHLKNTWGKSGWVRLEPFGADEITDETTECVQTFDNLVRDRAPHFLERWRKVLSLYEQNLAELKKIYNQLPTSVFQADWGDQNLLIDDKGTFKGVIDYNLAGEDTALNIFMSMGLFGLGHYTPVNDDPQGLPLLNEKTQLLRIDAMLDVFRELRKYYTFSEMEVTAAPLLYKYILPIEYAEIRAFEECAGDDRKMHLLFDFMEHELLRDDIDFRGVLTPFIGSESEQGLYRKKW